MHSNVKYRKIDNGNSSIMKLLITCYYILYNKYIIKMSNHLALTFWISLIKKGYGDSIMFFCESHDGIGCGVRYIFHDFDNYIHAQLCFTHKSKQPIVK